VIYCESFPTGPIQANCTLLGERDSGEGVVIDPGAEPELILERIRKSGLRIRMILHTHAHMDHAGATAGLARALPEGTPIALHPGDLPLYEGLKEQGALFGLEVENPPPPSLLLEDRQILDLGGMKIEVRHTPGHSPGSVCFLCEDAGLVVVGDVLFAGSIGRTDLWGGSFEILEHSIRQRLYTLDDATRVICGHGPETTIGREKNSNPFVRAT